MRSTSKYVREELQPNQVELTKAYVGTKEGVAASVALAVGISDCLDYSILNGDGWVSIGRTQAKDAIIITIRFGTTPVSFSGASLTEALRKVYEEYRGDL